MKKGKGKRSGVTKVINKEFYGYQQEDNHVENIKKQLDNNISEINFLGLFRFLKTYEERKDQLEKRSYKLVTEEWKNEIRDGDAPNFYYTTMTINNNGKIENWIKRKPFAEIKQLLLKMGMIFGDNPFKEYIVLGNDMKTEHIFYSKK